MKDEGLERRETSSRSKKGGGAGSLVDMPEWKEVSSRPKKEDLDSLVDTLNIPPR